MMASKFYQMLVCGFAMVLLPVLAEETRIEFEGGILNAATEGFTYLEKPVAFPESGELDFEFKPEYGLEKKFPEREVFTYYLFSARTDQGGLFAGINVIPDKPTVIWLYGKNPGANGSVFGTQGAFPVSKGEWCHIRVRWNEKNLQLQVNGKVAVSMNTASFKNYRLELPKTIQIGGSPSAPAAHGEFRNFVIRDIPKPVKTTIVGVPELTEMEICTENEQLLHLVAESPQAPSRLTIRPGILPVGKGQRFLVDFSNAVPYEVTAEKAGELIVEFPKRYRSDMIISPLPGDHLLPDGSFVRICFFF